MYPDDNEDFDDELCKMEEARDNKTQVDFHDNLRVIVDKQLSRREKAVMNTQVISSCVISNINSNNQKIVKDNNISVECTDCFCNIKKCDKSKDENGYYYCKSCWDYWNDNKDFVAPAFTKNWTHQYEKVCLD